MRLLLPHIFVISETPSLAESVVDLLREEGWEVRAVKDLAEAEALERGHPSPRPPLLVTACNEWRCEAPRRWPGSSLRGSRMLVLGGRDPDLRSSRDLHVMSLPFRSGELIELVGSLLGPS